MRIYIYCTIIYVFQSRWLWSLPNGAVHAVRWFAEYSNMSVLADYMPCSLRPATLHSRDISYACSLEGCSLSIICPCVLYLWTETTRFGHTFTELAKDTWRTSTVLGLSCMLRKILAQATKALSKWEAGSSGVLALFFVVAECRWQIQHFDLKGSNWCEEKQLAWLCSPSSSIVKNWNTSMSNEASNLQLDSAKNLQNSKRSKHYPLVI